MEHTEKDLRTSLEYKGDSWEDYPDPNFNPEITPENPNFNDPEYRTKRNTITI